MNPTIEQLADTIAYNLLRRRNAKGLSMRLLAKVSGVSANTIYRIENKIIIPTLDSLIKLANALDCQIAFLMIEGR